MSAIGFLRQYIKENENVTLEEILNDEEFLEELKIKDDFILN